MSNSSLVVYTKLSPNCTKPRKHAIDTITIHVMAFNGTVERCGDVFAPVARQASSNYGIGSDGRVGLYCDEANRSWCTSSSANDHRAVTIEVANDGGAATGWHVSDKALASLIELCADICRRNDIKALLWKNDKALIGRVDQQNMTIHRWFANKACPGDYLLSKHGYIAAEVNKRLNGELANRGDERPTTPPPAPIVVPDTIRKGDEGEVVKQLQALLVKRGYNLGTSGIAKNGVDGDFGAKTDAALRDFQKKNGLTIDGICGKNSWTKLLA